MNGEKLNLTLVSYSSQYSTSYPATNAFDGSTSSYWRSASSPTYPQNIVLELNDLYSVRGFRIYPNTSSYRPKSFKILVSSDGVNFDEVYSGTCSSSSNFLEFEFTNTLYSRYVKIEFTGASSSRLYVYEFEVYGVLITKKYLIRCNGVLYTVTDGVLTAMDATELTAEVFQTYGVTEVPTWSLLSGMVNPEVLLWYDTTEKTPELTAIMTATPFPQTLESEDYNMIHSSILGIEKVLVDASDDVRFAVSFDAGHTWKIHTGEAWATLSEGDTGMSPSVLSAITTEDWNAEATTGKFRFRITLPTVDDYVNSLVVDYLN